MPRLLGLLLLLPALELLAFLAVVAVLGFGKAILLQVAISLIGAAMLASLFTEAKAKARGGLLTMALDKRTGARGLAGLLFAMPGFVTDVLGVVALAPQLRARLRRLIAGADAAHPVTTKGPEPRRTAGPVEPGMLDLDTREWREVDPAMRPKA